MTDLIEMFNYEPCVLDIRGLDKSLVRRRLRQSFVNHEYEADDADYIVIANCDANGYLLLKDAINDLYSDFPAISSISVIPFQKYVLELFDEEV